MSDPDPINLGHHRSPRYRRWRGQLLHPIEEVRMFFDDQGPVPETFRRLKQRLRDARIPHTSARWPSLPMASGAQPKT